MTHVAFNGGHIALSKDALYHSEIVSDPEIRVVIVTRRHVGHEPIMSFHTAAHAPGRDMSHEAFADRWGASQDDIDNIKSFCALYGITITSEHRARREICLWGKVSSFNAAFGIKMYNASKHCDGKRVVFHHHHETISLPVDIDQKIMGIFGTSKEPFVKPSLRKHDVVPEFGSNPASVGFLTPAQVSTLYNVPQGNVSAQTIGVFVATNWGYNQSDITASCSAWGIAVPTITHVSVDGTTINNNAQTTGETTLDIMMAAGFAPGAPIAAYFMMSDSISTTLARMIFGSTGDPNAILLDFSGGFPDETAVDGGTIGVWEAYASDAALVGKSIFVSSGDGGTNNGVTGGSGNGLVHAGWPTSSPWVTSCGGTVIGNISGNNFTEWLWNLNTASNSNGGAGGGGVSIVYKKPSYQANAAIPVSIANGVAGRGFPDISGNASPASGYTFTYLGQRITVGGTSATAPMYCGIFAQINAGLGRNVGFINPTVYANPTTACRKITDAGGGPPDNAGQAGAPGYPVKTSGWDACTGLGVIIPNNYGSLTTIPIFVTIQVANSDTLVGNSPSGTLIGAVNVFVADATFTGTLTLSGTYASSFQIISGDLHTNGNVLPGTYDFNITATQAGIDGSPFTEALTVTATNPTTTSYWIEIQASNSAGTGPMSSVYGPVAVLI